MPKQNTQSSTRSKNQKFRRAFLDGDRDAMKLAVQNGANPNGRMSKGGLSYLDDAEERYWSGGIAALLECGVIADDERVRQLAATEDDDGFFPMHQAAADGFNVALTRLLDAGVDPDMQNLWDGGGPLLMAVQCAREDTVRFLLNRRADVDGSNARGITPLYEACTRGEVEIVRALLLHGADIDARICADADDGDAQVEGEGWSVLEMADAWCGDEIKTILRHHKAMRSASALKRTLAQPTPSATTRRARM